MTRAAGRFTALATATAALLAGCASVPQAAMHDTVIRGGTVYDGSGGAPFVGDVAIDGDRIADVGTVEGRGRTEIDASGMAVSPGLINMLSWANESLIVDGRGMSDLKQGITLEVFGEGWSMGPYTQAMKDEATARQGDIKYPITWTTLGEYLQFLEDKGVSPNIASFVGATTVRMHELGEADVDPTPRQLSRMRALVRTAMEEGALGVGSSLIYAPANYAETPELVALLQEAGQCGGMYISHMRSEGDNIAAAIDELVTIAREADVPAEIYHLKLAGKDNWDRLPEVIAQIEAARAEGLEITTDMYLYTAGGTFLAAVTPPWAQDGGYDALLARLRDPATRARIVAEMRRSDTGWENLLRLAGGGENVLLVGFSNPDMKGLTGKTLAEVAQMRGVSVEDAVIDLLLEDGSGISAAFFLMSEENVRRQTALPYMSFGSDAEAPAAEGIFLQSDTHPRAYGNFARLLGKYVREEQALSLAEAVRKLTALPAENLSIRDRGLLAEGKFADVVIFDPATIGDKATYAEPHQYSTGVRDVFVNGVQVLAKGEHTGAAPGRFVHGPGWTGWPDGGACR
ncbi:N-acyl-D-amino-acid deacylase family protein [Croceicoccus marinus]|jgi:N-acyl-D-amino-acid deacylase|uniref:Amidohydrolase family protein n=1 Tax=Croceicoccus marinus TaxID=450378 RepID=A0A1Z1FGW4_9SPHN|nr:aminoacylase [Croceicoccus marinus]QNE07490.1 amidohydrolase family protein [Croceicoccus marinus]